MALYDYKCDACNGRFELNHPMSAKPVAQCPECGSDRFRKILSTGGVVSGGGSGGGEMPEMPASPCGMGGCASGMCGLG